MLNIYEHIGVLRWAGFDGIEISSSSPWPPYHGRTQELFRALFEKSTQSPDQLQWCSISRTVRADYPGSANRHIILQPADKPQLDLVIICDYPGLGKKELHFSWPRQNLSPAFSAHSPAWPAWMYCPAKVAGMLGWPHVDKFCWPQVHRENTLEMFCQHRLIDLLGDLSLIHPTRMFAGTVISHCAGHWADIEVIRKAQPLIRLL